MTHIDSGTLHAYLDNQLAAGAALGPQAIDAHLAQCPQCRALLEEARQLRERAQGILSQSGPRQVEAPPFADVLARAARQRTRRSTRPMVALAWAASLVLAVTVGWYARNLATRQASPAANVVATQEVARASGIEATPPAPRQVAQAVPPHAETVAVEPPVSAGAGAVSPTAGVASQNRPVADVAFEAKGAVDTPAPAAVAAPAPAMRRAERQAAGLEVGAAWVTVSPAEAARRLGGPLAMIPGLPSLGTSLSGTGESAVARTIQVLGPGQTIELVQQRAATREPGVVAVQWEGFSVSGRALVPQDSLRKLLQRLAPAQPLR